MKQESIENLLEVGYSLYQKQKGIQKMFGEYCLFFQKEIQLIFHTVSSGLGIEIHLGGGNSNDLFESFCKSELTKTDLLQVIFQSQEALGNQGLKLPSLNKLDLVNTLSNLKYTIQHKKKKVESFFLGECDFLNREREMLEEIIFRELGTKRYFQEANHPQVSHA